MLNGRTGKADTEGGERVISFSSPSEVNVSKQQLSSDELGYLVGIEKNLGDTTKLKVYVKYPGDAEFYSSEISGAGWPGDETGTAAQHTNIAMRNFTKTSVEIAARANNSLGQIWVFSKSGKQLAHIDGSGGNNAVIQTVTLPSASYEWKDVGSTASITPALTRIFYVHKPAGDAKTKYGMLTPGQSIITTGGSWPSSSGSTGVGVKDFSSTQATIAAKGGSTHVYVFDNSGKLKDSIIYGAYYNGAKQSASGFIEKTVKAN